MPQKTSFIIALKTDEEALFWSNETGWGDKDSATRFTQAERAAFAHPDPAHSDKPNISVMEPGARWVED
ncbi:MAG: hypothetical protein CL949_09990 [Erythrobacter sp.]|nr:hypothetical protein [Erythrobacter sp.]